MWIFVFFDLPVTTPKGRKQATRFRNFLLNDGYTMVQYSVYARICNGQERVDKHMRRLRVSTPDEGYIRALQITDKQYGRMQTILGKKRDDKGSGPEQLLLF